MSLALEAQENVPSPPPAALFVLRQGRPSDWALVVRSWLDGDKFTPMGRAMGEAFAIEHEITIHTVLARADVHVRIAHAPDDDDALLGYAVLQPKDPAVVFYVYVKRDARKLGIASALLADLGDQSEYTSRPAIKGQLPIPASWSFNPIRLYR